MVQKSSRKSVVLATLLGATLILSGCDQLNQLTGRQAQQAAPAPPVVPAAPATPAQTTQPAQPASVAAPAQTASAKSEPSLEVRSHIKQGFAYISTAKNARDSNIRQENIENAINEFSLAIQKDPNYADAYSHRAVAYMQQKKFNKAQEDLKQAKELAPQNAAIRYNFASLHSLKGDVDLALDEIDAALTRGFADYDALRKDPDLDNVRRHPEFRKILEKHKVFIVK
jgi:Flp pilus assembly protein TadD